MPKIDIAVIPASKGTDYPPPFDAPCATRTRQQLGEAGGLRDFGVNLTSAAGSNHFLRHQHDEREFRRPVRTQGRHAVFTNVGAWQRDQALFHFSRWSGHQE